MRYIANDRGYLQEVSFGAMIECGDKSCTAYTGGVPEGYDSLADWFTQEADKLHRWHIVEGELTLDENAPEPEEYVEPEAELTTTIVKLWENASPTSSFAAQTIALDLSEYSMVFCNCRLSTEYATIVPTNPIPVGADYGAYAYGLAAGYPVRRTFRATATGVVFEEGMKYTSFGSSNVNSSNGSLIPVEIYGIKGVQAGDTPDEPVKAAICGEFLCGEVICGQ